LRCPDGSVWGPFPKISEAMDGRREAHTDVLVAVFGKGPQTQPTTIESRLGTKLRPHAPKQSLKLGDILLDVVYERLHGRRRMPGLGVDHAPTATQGEAGDVEGLQGTQSQFRKHAELWHHRYTQTGQDCVLHCIVGTQFDGWLDLQAVLLAIDLQRQAAAGAGFPG